VLVVEFQICTEQDIIIRLINVHVLIIMYALPCKSRLNVRAPSKTTALETHEYILKPPTTHGTIFIILESSATGVPSREPYEKQNL
jgi:hypothetical protein